MDAPPTLSLRDRTGGIVATATVLALLYFGRDVLVPITLAVILSLLIAPLVRMLRHVGLGQTMSVLAAVLVLVFSCASMAVVIGMQFVRMTTSLPQYERTIKDKLATLNDYTIGRLNLLTGQTGPGEAQPGALAPAPAQAVPQRAPRVKAAARSAIPGQAMTGQAGAGQAGPGQAGLIQAAPMSGAPVQGAPMQAGSVQAALMQGAPGQAAPTQAGPTQAAPMQAAPLQPVPVQPVPIPVEVHNPAPSSLQVLQKVIGSIWVPLETAGIVLVVMIFMLLEHEALRDRFIRIAGGTDIRATTLALNDAGERLSRFFVSQFVVNLGVGSAISLGLTLIGLPHALLWGALAGVLRFVPYIGVWIAALFATALGAAVDPGWSLAIVTLTLFVIVELVAGQLVEPQLYGHTTGLSPLSVVIAAIFWSWLWGPTGLIVSTPLTLCLVVAGRHIKALSLLDVLLGNTQALTMPQRFYQRALSADSDEIIAAARQFLKRSSLAAYCDVVLMPALALARIDITTGAINQDQLARVRAVMVSVIGAIGGDGRRRTRRTRRRERASVLDELNIGRLLRAQREQVAGPFQGPLAVPPGSVMLCVGLGSIVDELATELLVRILRDQDIDARHVSIDELQRPPPPGALTSIALVYLVSAFPSEERERGETVAQMVRQHLPGACLVTVFLPGILLQPGPATDTLPSADKAAGSFGHAVEICLDLQQDRTRAGAATEGVQS
jgi:predicted PurR-regulated permease PerM